VQDLHGYENPWPAGGGKNKLNITANTVTAKGVTFTVNKDSDGNFVSIVADGTAEGNIAYSDITFGRVTLNAGNYIFNGLSTGSQSTWRMVAYDNASSTSYGSAYNGNNVSFTLEDTTTITVYPVILTGQELRNVEFYPMIRLATETDVTFAPYSNICPISGHTGAEIVQTGKNIWDEEWENGSISNETGQDVANSNIIRTKGYISVKPGLVYALVKPISSVHGLAFYNANKAFISYRICNNSALFEEITTPNNCYYMRFRCISTYGATYNNDISINYPATDTTYHHYTSNQISVNWEDEAGTIYGGEDEVISGELKKTYHEIDLGDLAWSMSS